MATEAQISKQTEIAEDLSIMYPHLSDEKIERYANAIERAERYPAFGDGLTRPVAISNVSSYADPAGNLRTVINLACKTTKSYGQPLAHERKMPMPNANLSFPAEWNSKWRQGDYVCVLIEDGEVKKLYPANTMQAAQININKKTVDRTMEQAQHGDETLSIDPETGEVPTDEPKAKLGAVPKGGSKPAVATEQNPDDLPF